MNYLKDNILECCFKKYNRILLFRIHRKHRMMENPRPKEEKIVKDIRNLFRLKRTKLHCN